MRWSFWKWDNNLDDEEHSDQPLGVDKDQLRASIEADLLTTTWEVAKELYNNHSMVACHLKQTEKVKNLSKWVPHEWTTNQKKIILKCPLFLCNNNEPLLDQIVTCDEKWIVYDNQIVYDQLSGWTEKKLQSTSQT